MVRELCRRKSGVYFLYIRLLTDAIGAGFAMTAHIKMQVGFMGFVCLRPQNSHEKCAAFGM
jgi:hypothetical protein